MEIVIPAASSRDPGQRYRVLLSDAGDECDCPDFYWRHINRGDAEHRCKHIIAARRLLVEGIPGPDRQSGRRLGDRQRRRAVAEAQAEASLAA